MSVDFSPPSYRAASSDLTISISPLGLVELADEEFEVHGPRLNRYSLNFAMYLGHQHAFRRETGEPQLVFNFYRAMTDFVNRFTFGRGVHFRSPKATEAIIPDLLKRIWEEDNTEGDILLEIGQLGGVTGDAFIKVAYEEPFQDTAGNYHPGRVRILPLNPAHCFPEYHPHDRDRFLRFKLKYRIWTTSLEGTRQVATYTEIISDDAIEEYYNDELIDSRPNPLGVIPVVHIPNMRVSGSPWGIPDCHDIIVLNRHYNEVAIDLADIINYHSAPVTIITGAKASNLEKGAKKVWAGLPKEASVFNLEGGYQGLQGGLQYLDMLKRAMHEMVGVPETALGQVQPISNTSGVALSIQFQPLMNRYQQKVAIYGKGLEKVNEYALRTLAIKEPDKFVWNPDSDTPIGEGQLPQLDLQDPLTYRSYVHFPPPLPLDKLVVLNEIQQKMQLGLESREGALRTLGEEFPEQKLAEIREELRQDALNDGALNMIKAEIQKQIMDFTGMQVAPDGTAMPMEPMMMGDGDVMGDGVDGPNPQMQPNPVSLEVEADILNQLTTLAYGGRLAQYRAPENADSPKQDS